MNSKGSWNKLTSFFRNDEDKKSEEKYLLDNEFERKKNLHDFQVLKKLGHGGFGRVFLARHIHDNQLVALKVRQKNHNVEVHETNPDLKCEKTLQLENNVKSIFVELDLEVSKSDFGCSCTS